MMHALSADDALCLLILVNNLYLLAKVDFLLIKPSFSWGCWLGIGRFHPVSTICWTAVALMTSGGRYPLFLLPSVYACGFCFDNGDPLICVVLGMGLVLELEFNSVFPQFCASHSSLHSVSCRIGLLYPSRVNPRFSVSWSNLLTQVLNRLQLHGQLVFKPIGLEIQEKIVWQCTGVRVRWWSFRGWICHITEYQLCQISWGALDPSLSSMSAITSSNFFLQYLGSEYPVLSLTRTSTPSLHIFSVKAHCNQGF